MGRKSMAGKNSGTCTVRAKIKKKLQFLQILV